MTNQGASSLAGDASGDSSPCTAPVIPGATGVAIHYFAVPAGKNNDGAQAGDSRRARSTSAWAHPQLNSLRRGTRHGYCLVKLTFGLSANASGRTAQPRGINTSPSDEHE